MPNACILTGTGEGLIHKQVEGKKSYAAIATNAGNRGSGSNSKATSMKLNFVQPELVDGKVIVNPPQRVCERGYKE